jgi:hypothetical protein
MRHRKAFLERWSELIATFSMAHLSRIDDKLIACSAIAKQCQPILGSYAAGLWKEYLPSQLLWSYHHFCGASYSNKHKMRPRSKPTWSWASPDSRVELPYYCDAAQYPDFVTKNDHSLRKPVDFNVPTLVEALGVQITLHDKDPTGLVGGGWIRLRCNELLCNTWVGPPRITYIMRD